LRLICAECGRLSDEKAAGWHAYHALEQFCDEEYVLPFCPQCAKREYGLNERRIPREHDA
jgi:hypothetical protein